MSALALVLFVLTRYHSPSLAGLVIFLSIFPGTLVSPIAGALLDRHGRRRLIILDYLLGGGGLILIGVLGLLNLLPVPLLLLIAGLQALTAPLSTTGLRTLFPLLVPRHLWERANAVDSNGYVVASIFGPALAGALVALGGGELALIATGALSGLAAISLVPLRDPETNTDTTGNLLRDAWLGLVYVLRNQSLRGLALAISVGNLGGGILFVALPVLVLSRFHQGPATVGILFAVMGISGFAAATLFGRMRTEGRERQMLSWPQVGFAAAILLLVYAPNLAWVVLGLFVMGVLVAPIDIALFTLRQRRTDPAWLGRAFAVSMALNFSGVPIGSALAGPLLSWSLAGAFVIAALLTALAGIIALLTIPAQGDYLPEGQPSS
jgi:MFS family permease